MIDKNDKNEEEIGKKKITATLASRLTSLDLQNQARRMIFASMVSRGLRRRPNNRTQCPNDTTGRSIEL